MSDIDQKTVEYVLENQEAFRGSAAGNGAAGRTARPGRRRRRAVRRRITRCSRRRSELFHEAVDGLRRARVPIRARPHHHAVMQAAAAVRRALDAARRSLGRPGARQRDIDPILIPLRERLRSPAARRAGAARLRDDRVRSGMLRRSSRGQRHRFAPEGSTMSSYSIWVMDTRTCGSRPTSLFVYGAHNQGHRKMPYGYVVIKGRDQTAMVDVGYNHEAYGEVLAEQLRRPKTGSRRATVLGECGLTPADISNGVHHARAFRSHGQPRGFSECHVLHPGARAVEVGVGDVARAAVPLADARHRPGGHHADGRSRAAGTAGRASTAIATTCCRGSTCVPPSTPTPGDRCM